MDIGIDKIGFYAPHLYVDMNKLAVSREVEPEKFTIGIGQEKMAVAPITQDTVTLAANAALDILTEADKEKIDFVIFGTETGVDHSKSAGVYIHHLLGMNPWARTVEVKQACYGATAAIQMAKGHIALNPSSKVLVLGADIARYGLKTSGEATQGAGAIAMVISAEPKIMKLEEHSAYLTADVMDFWRPVYSEMALVDGKLSNEQYISFFSKIWGKYKEKSGLALQDFEAICYHLPYTKMGYKALKTVLDETAEETQERLLSNYKISTQYSRNIGNIYTGSLYLALLSLLEQKEDLAAGSRIGLFSYGSGAVGEFFTGILQPNYRNYLNTRQHTELFSARTEVSVSEYEQIFAETLPKDGTSIELDTDQDPAKICLAGMKDHMRQYIHKTK
ncbi:hydroxymethylglutaryl-CoA synthase [Virgibacillus alimentarius]|uniref:Hydroxymethylglutaryl-CoA synthase n=1 Tax=Virgibacillus alimentarius TaxID=698769 RepID=A0ABS4SBH4_9BACI|nr:MULTISPECIES: hydroxymethylglutaryl-CoA synthase [Virgibacillus]MBP2258707.1 hydroxymethylglutaryl-CoA synthase [Virgibacillus alimentarius]HLR66729.1 hydroxymethylglutaryl-CoA synthase [Virgibacillus sp.]